MRGGETYVRDGTALVAPAQNEKGNKCTGWKGEKNVVS